MTHGTELNGSVSHLLPFSSHDTVSKVTLRAGTLNLMLHHTDTQESLA